MKNIRYREEYVGSFQNIREDFERGETNIRKPRWDLTKSRVFPWVEEESEFAAGTLNLPANT